MPEEPQTPKKSALLETIRTQRATFESLFAGLTDSQMATPGVEAAWSIKDLLAHIAAWERLATDRLHAALTGDPLNFPLIQGDADADQFNAEVYAQHKDQPLPEVQREYQEAHNAFMAQIESLDEEFLPKPLPFDWAGKLTAQVMISANTHWHYAEHAEALEKWLDRQDF